jgi:hypothetical protein
MPNNHRFFMQSITTFLLMFCFDIAGIECVYADELPAVTSSPTETVAAPAGDSGGYHTPLAGEPYHTVFMGQPIDVPAQDRGNVSALTLGATYYTPSEGDTSGSPIFALYFKRVWDESRTRDIVSIFINDLEYDRTLWKNLELVTRFENNTIPGGQSEVLNNQTIDATAQEYGTIMASIGPGLRFKVAPFQIDNDLRLQLLARAGYFYDHRVTDTGPNVVLPPDTMLYGAKLRARYDGMRRNILELPHQGMAAGFDLDFIYRDKWGDFGSSPNIVFTKHNTQDYTQASGYVIGVSSIPGLSEKNKILVSYHGGTSEKSSVDRYNAFRISGGPLPGESDDLSRVDYPGTMFGLIPVANYNMVAVEYRRELTFFMYLHLRGTYLEASRANIVGTDQVGFVTNYGKNALIGLDTGFLWNSELYLAYEWDSGFIRNGTPGSGLILTWNKSL